MIVSTFIVQASFTIVTYDHQNIFITQATAFVSSPGACIIKLIAAVIYVFLLSARVFVPEPFQLSLVFVGKARRIP